MKTPLCTGYESTVGMTRRHFLNSFGMGLGGIALSSLLKSEALLGATNSRGILGTSHFAPKAKRVIYLFQSGGPSQLDLYDPKPTLIKKHGTELPKEIRQGQRLTAMSGNQASLPLAGSPFKFTLTAISLVFVSFVSIDLAKSFPPV